MGKRLVTFDHLIEITSGVPDTPCSRPGDAGALVCDTAGQALGLVFAGSEEVTYVLPIVPILDRFSLTLARPG